MQSQTDAAWGTMRSATHDFSLGWPLFGQGLQGLQGKVHVRHLE